MGSEVKRIVDLYSIPVLTACPDAFPPTALMRRMNADRPGSLERQILHGDTFVSVWLPSVGAAHQHRPFEKALVNCSIICIQIVSQLQMFSCNHHAVMLP